jgi:hypothetical protein
MIFRRAASVGFVLLLMEFCNPAMAAVTTIAVTGSDVSGVVGGKFDLLSEGTVNEAGELVFSAQLQQGFGGVDPNNDAGIWIFNGASTTLLARKGAGDVPGTVGGSFSEFHDWGIDAAGDVALRATLVEGSGGVTADNEEGF